MERVFVVLLAVSSMSASGLAARATSSVSRSYQLTVIAISSVGMAALAFLLVRWQWLDLGIATAMACSGGSTGTVLARWARSDTQFAGEVVVASALLSAVIVPAALLMLGHAHAVDPVAVIAPPLLFQMLPFFAGRALRERLSWLAPIMSRISSIMFVVTIGAFIAKEGGTLLEQSARTMLVIVVTVASGFVAGALLPAKKELWKASVVTTGNRNLSLPLLITASMGLPSLGILLFGVVMFPVGMLTARVMR